MYCKNSIFIFFVALTVFACLLYFIISDKAPYNVPISFTYKSKYYQKFITPEGYDEETQGRYWSGWHTSGAGIQMMTDLFNNSAGYINKNPNDKSSIKAMKLWEDWIGALTTKLEDIGVLNPHWIWSGIPWGDDWQPFSIDLPINLGYYIVNKAGITPFKHFAAKIIQSLIPNPKQSMGFDRDGITVATMLFPWIVSHIATGDLDKNNEGYIYAVNQFNIAPDQIGTNEVGMHIDYGYRTLGTPSYGFGDIDLIYEIYTDTVQIIPELADLEVETHIDKVNSILKHPTIPMSGGTLYRIKEDVEMGLYTGATKTPQVIVLPSLKYIRYFTDDWQWCSTVDGSRYYANNEGVLNMGSYSLFCRKMFRRGDTDTSPKFPVAGFISPKGTTELPKTSPGHTTYERLGSYVFTDYKHYAVSKVEDLRCDFFDYNVTISETIVIDIQAKKAVMWYLIGEPDTMQICLDNKTNHDVGPTGVCSINIDFEKNTYSGQIHDDMDELPTIKTLTNNMFSDEAFSDDHPKRSQVVIFNEKYKDYLITPGDLQVMSYEKFTIGDRKQTYKFDPKMNQFMYIGYDV
ncbi:ODV-E66 [Homarus gammarus nudivirus]|uniref:ODV-E66 n=1 Tax=Homarus gammarus nudivirus TaxID=2509616 RepID=A0A411HB43_9VIRU|nr:ODV-E66 [Homarus gammarus nudivirus]QBB28630.1 ODV-E66 [Homarus gammarus nudivirus]